MSYIKFLIILIISKNKFKNIFTINVVIDYIRANFFNNHYSHSTIIKIVKIFLWSILKIIELLSIISENNAYFISFFVV